MPQKKESGVLPLKLENVKARGRVQIFRIPLTKARQERRNICLLIYVSNAKHQT